jgi:CBS domain-containing protein
MEPYAHQIADDTTIDQANNLFEDPHVPYLIVYDGAGRCEGLVTRSRLQVFLARSWYTRRTLIRDTSHQHGPFARPGMQLQEAADEMRTKHLRAWPVVDDDGRPLGILTARQAKATKVEPMMPPAVQRLLRDTPTGPPSS